MMRDLKMIIGLVAFLTASCGANEGILRSGREANSPSGNVEPAKSTFARDLEEFRTADFSYIYVLRRKDGGQIDAEDRGVIKAQTAIANRRVSADDGKAFIIGTNTALTPENMAAIYARFAVENYSTAPPPTKANTAANANSNK